MTITYTQHALARMAERGIDQQEVEATLKNPIRQISFDHGRIESQGLIERSGKNYYFELLVKVALLF
jgi:hypothetical protein